MIYIKRGAESLPVLSPLTVTSNADDELTADVSGVVSQCSVYIEVRIRRVIVNLKSRCYC